jgi:catechol 2,3-dioxygenase-like lactoylglutathione lyase family enzyme
MINGIHHPAISTPDIDRLVAFYTGVGFKVVAENQWDKGTEFADTITDLKDSSARQVLLHLGNCYLELFQFLSPEPRPADRRRPVCDHGYTHICLDVTDLDAEYRRLLELGMTFHCPPQDFAPGIRNTYGRDPDGNVIELHEVLADSVLPIQL